ncbi:MAG: amidohydrolase family protein, partial [Flavisolibacter sp.]|nr:amidohydrolase family protein [Flavisolibacter sp.]
MFDLILKSKQVLTPEGTKAAQVLIKDEQIVDVLPYASEIEGNVVEIDNGIILPGLMDPHVHINEPGRTHWEGFDTATKAALAGGLTTIVDMPLNSSPVTTSVKAFEKKLAALD